MLSKSVLTSWRIQLYLLLGFFTLLKGNYHAYASPERGYFIQQSLARYFPLPEDAISLAASGAGALNCVASACIYQNPAGLGFLKSSELGGSIGWQRVTGTEFGTKSDRITQSEWRGYTALAMPLGKSSEAGPSLGGLALGYSRYQGHSNDNVNSTPDGHLRSLGYGLSPSSKLSLGYGLTFYDDQLSTEFAELHSHARFLHLLGAQYLVSDEVSLGALVKIGVGQSDTYYDPTFGDGLSYPRERGVALGITGAGEYGKISFGLDYSHLRSRGFLPGADKSILFGGDEEGDQFNLRAGGLTYLTDNLALLAGVRWNLIYDYEYARDELIELSGGLSILSFSGGLKYVIQGFQTQLEVAYGVRYAATARGDMTHALSLIVPFK